LDRTTSPQMPGRRRGVLRAVVLLLGAFIFLFPFYYMLIGSLQAEPDTSLSGVVPRGNITLENYREINRAVNLGRPLVNSAYFTGGALNLARPLVNSGIFTGGVVLFTVVFGLLAGYALARLQFLGRGAIFALV